MRITDIIGLMGAVASSLGLLISLIVLSSDSDTPEIAALISGPFFLLLLFSLGVLWFTRSSPWHIKNSSNKLVIASDGTARWKNTLHLRSNRVNNARYTHRGLEPSEKIRDLTVSEEVIVVMRDQLLVEEIVEVRIIKGPIRFLGSHVHTISATWDSAFGKEKEAFIVQVAESTSSIEVEIEFPEDRTPCNAWALYGGNMEKRALHQPKIQDNVLTWRHKRSFFALPRGNYEVWWLWESSKPDLELHSAQGGSKGDH